MFKMSSRILNRKRLSQHSEGTEFDNTSQRDKNKKEILSLLKIFCLLYIVIVLLNISTDENHFGDAATGQPGSSVTVPIMNQANAQQFSEKEVPITRPEEMPATPLEEPSSMDTDSDYTVQAVLAAKNQVVLASGIDAKIIKFDLESGDRFKKGKVLVEYDCSVDYARLNEVLSRQRVTEKQLNAYRQLANMESASDIEVLMAQENNEQNKALISQIRGRLKSCKHVAPWDGRVTRKMASKYEYVQTGRVLMEISSLDPLRAEFLIPSLWLRWLNIGTPLEIYINETGNSYKAKIINIHGEVDPVSQSIQVVAEMEKYHEELLPGMSGKAIFRQNLSAGSVEKGYLGIRLVEDETEGKL